MKLYLLFLFAFIVTTIGAPLELKEPSEDDFYNAPLGFEDEEVGSILKWRKTPATIKSIGFSVNITNSWQMLVRSEDALGNPIAIASTIFEPYNANSSRLLSYQIAEDSGYVNCAPSYSFMGGGGFSTVIGRAEMFLIQSALDLGYYVVSPDYEGPNAVFTVGSTSGMSTLNSLRAALNGDYNNVTGIRSDADVVLWGYSGGTIASGWAAAMAPTYAKDLKDNLKGVAIGGWVTNITSTAEIIEGGLFQGLAPSAITGLSQQYPDIKKYLKGHIISNKTQLFDRAQKDCLVDAILDFAYQNVFDGPERFADVGWGIFDDEVVKKRIEQNTLGIKYTEKLMPEIPVFVYHGVKDEIVPFKDAQRVYDVWCDQGIDSFEFAVSNSTGHILEVIEGSGAALSWINRIFEGDQAVDGCQRTARLSNVFYPGSFGGIGDILKAFIAGARGSDIGPRSDIGTSDEAIVRRMLNLD